MMKLSKALLIAGFGLALTVSAHAQAQKAANATPPSASAVAAATELLTIKKANQIYQNIVPTVIQRTKDAILQTNVNYQKDLNEIALKLAGELAAKRDDVGKAMAEIYATNFTEQELRDLIAFYKTPLGQKFLEMEPKSIAGSIAFMNDWANAFSNEVAAKFRSEMRARGKEI
ncbi:DUF2059 domain-containing protein [Bradyrhizobium sp. WD16]|uniref:DUF2059 domain-containing protein n=1 Tax=Bradyrhizobium sp. WD16 TaxID=1521768 RepID=UPI0020A3226F|nr:DUF2059 domain-containing protein [Bradyrhizobium sp. WD16]UTD29705.1 hypothetical protein DB459_25150 [Bradyrhizobium sp. WD16]